MGRGKDKLFANKTFDAIPGPIKNLVSQRRLINRRRNDVRFCL